LAILCGVLTGCADGVTVLMDQKQASAAGVPLEGSIAMDGSGNVYLVSKGLVWRYDIAKGAFQQETQKPSASLVDLAVGDDGVVLALDEGRVLALASGNLVPVAAIPGQAYKLSAAPGCLYVATRRQDKYQVLRYRLSARRLEPVLQSESPITAICGLADGVLVASGESIFKVTAPRPTTQPASAEVVTSLVCAIYGAEIQSIAADPQRRIFYFSEGRATFFWADGHVRELLPSGGMLAVRNDRLVISSPVQGQLVQIGDASKKVRQVHEATSSQQE
jgi:prepilin-type processing-associated H-X9-DG protein